MQQTPLKLPLKLSRYFTMRMLSYAFWTPELITTLRSLNRSTKRILDEERNYIEANSTRLKSVTCQLNALSSQTDQLIGGKMMLSLDVDIDDFDFLKVLTNVNEHTKLCFSNLRVKSQIINPNTTKML